MRCTKQTVGQIVDSGNDYLIAVKRNQPNLYQELNAQFEQAVEMNTDIQTDSSHGRQVQRNVSVLTPTEGIALVWVVSSIDQPCLFKGDLAARYGRGSPAHKSETRQGDSNQLRVSKIAFQTSSNVPIPSNGKILTDPLHKSMIKIPIPLYHQGNKGITSHG